MPRMTMFLQPYTTKAMRSIFKTKTFWTLVLGLATAITPTVGSIILRHTPDQSKSDVSDIIAIAGAFAALVAGVAAKSTDPTVYTPDGIAGADKPRG